MYQAFLDDGSEDESGSDYEPPWAASSSDSEDRDNSRASSVEQVRRPPAEPPEVVDLSTSPQIESVQRMSSDKQSAAIPSLRNVVSRPRRQSQDRAPVMAGATTFSTLGFAREGAPMRQHERQTSAPARTPREIVNLVDSSSESDDDSGSEIVIVSQRMNTGVRRTIARAQSDPSTQRRQNGELAANRRGFRLPNSRRRSNMTHAGVSRSRKRRRESSESTDLFTQRTLNRQPQGTGRRRTGGRHVSATAAARPRSSGAASSSRAQHRSRSFLSGLYDATVGRAQQYFGAASGSRSVVMQQGESMDYDQLLQLDRNVVKRGAGIGVISALPRFKYTGKGPIDLSEDSPGREKSAVSREDSDNHKCVICLCEYEDGDQVIMTPCIHKFHEDCLVPWLKSNTQCPICKYRISDALSS